jgi:hypothetical protein
MATEDAWKVERGAVYLSGLRATAARWAPRQRKFVVGDGGIVQSLKLRLVEEPPDGMREVPLYDGNSRVLLASLWVPYLQEEAADWARRGIAFRVEGQECRAWLSDV